MEGRTAFINGKNVPYVARDCSVGIGNAPMARFMQACVRYKAYFTDSLFFAKWEERRPQDTVFLRVFIPEPFVEAFIQAANMQDVSLPPIIKLN
jgi:hypothetical protein